MTYGNAIHISVIQHPYKCQRECDPALANTCAYCRKQIDNPDDTRKENMNIDYLLYEHLIGNLTLCSMVRKGPIGSLAQLVRAQDSQSWGRGFKPHSG